MSMKMQGEINRLREQLERFEVVLHGLQKDLNRIASEQAELFPVPPFPETLKAMGYALPEVAQEEAEASAEELEAPFA